MPNRLTYCTIARIMRVSPNLVRGWETRGLLAGDVGYERIVKLEERSMAGLYAFVRAVYPHSSLRTAPSDLIRDALGIDGPLPQFRPRRPYLNEIQQ